MLGARFFRQAILGQYPIRFNAYHGSISLINLLWKDKISSSMLSMLTLQLTMKQLLLLLSLFFITCVYGQTTTTQHFELTKKNLKRVFSIKPGFCCPEEQPEWTACYNTDSTYSTADTIRLYSDQYHYMGAHCCYITSWSFHNTTTFSLSKTHVCEEPPPSRMSPDDYKLRIKFSKNGNYLTISIRKKGKLRNKFDLIALEGSKMYNGDAGYMLTMVRRKE